jgi:hypothetical protein
MAEAKATQDNPEIRNAFRAYLDVLYDQLERELDPNRSFYTEDRVVFLSVAAAALLSLNMTKTRFTPRLGKMPASTK